MPPARDSIPAMFVDVPQRFGRRDGAAYPLRVADAPTMTAAAWAQHELVQALRVWVVTAGFSTPNAWIRQQRLSKTSWGRIMRGEQWLTLENLAFLARQFGEPAQRQVAALASSLNGDNLPQTPTAAARRRPSRSSAAVVGNRVRNGLGKGGTGPSTATESVWAALTTLSDEHRVQIPRSLIVYGGDVAGLWGEPGWEASATVQDPAGPPLPVVGGYYVLSGDPRPGGDVVVADLVVDPIEGPTFVDRQAVVTSRRSIDFEQ